MGRSPTIITTFWSRLRQFAGQFRSLTAIVCGLLLGAGLSYSALVWFGYIGLLGSLWLLQQPASFRQRLRLGWLVGVSKVAIVLSWFFSAYPLDWLGLAPGFYQYGLIAVYLVPAIVILGVSGVLVAVGIHYIHSYTRHFFWPIAVAVLWLMSEVAAAWLFSAYTLGPGSRLQANFTFGHTGYLFAQHDWLLQATVFGGVYTLTIIGVAMLAYIYQTHSWRVASVVLVGLIASSLVTPPLLVHPAMTPAPERSVITLETDWLRGAEAEAAALKTRLFREAIQAAAQYEPAYLILPEDSRVTQYLGGGTPSSTLAWLSEYFNDTIIIDSGRSDFGKGVVQRATVYDLSESAYYQFDKQYLVPQGEYVPHVYQWLLQWLALPEGTERALTDTAYYPGIAQTSLSLPSHIPPVLFCFESVPAWGAARINQPEAPFIAHVVSHAWFNQPPHSLWHQLDMRLRVQAVQAGIPIVQASNRAPAFVWVPSGERVRPTLLEQGQRWRLYQFTIN